MHKKSIVISKILSALFLNLDLKRSKKYNIHQPSAFWG